MSEAVRTELADAANTVDGISCHPHFVQAFDPGRAWVRLDRIEYPNPFGGVCHWNLIVVLPGDQAAAEQYLDQVAPVIKTAVEPYLVITQIQPQRLEIKGVGIVPCVFINGHREQE